MKQREPLAIIGIGCRFPGDVNSPEEFWKLLIDKKDALGKIPPDRWDTGSLYAPEFRRAGKISVNRGGFINDVDKFDAIDLMEHHKQRIDDALQNQMAAFFR